MEPAELLAAARRGTALVAACSAVESTWRAWVVAAPAIRLEDRPGARNRDLDLVRVVREWHPDCVENFPGIFADEQMLADLETTFLSWRDELL
jgi:hypothetical protein